MGKRKVELTKKQRHEVVSGIPDKYDYMDRLPMNGWAWEFVRRNEKYIEAFIKLEEKVKKGVWNDECNKILSELQNVASPTGLLIGRVSSNMHKTDRGNFLTLNLPPYEGDRARLNKYFGRSHHVGVIPRPETRYCDFPVAMAFRPQIPDYEIYKSFDVLLNQQTTLMLSPNSNIPIEKPSVDRDKDVFYIAVSKNAKIAELKEYMLADIANILKKHKPRVRQRKWKNYLIVYDLRQEFSDKISYDELAKILIHAYPEDQTEYFAEIRNINHWYDYATVLINGGFIKYLKHETQSPTK
jgi:hypothetical protein